jgi:hypothetical protein
MSEWKGKYPVSIALVHYPVMDKSGRITATSTTNFDIHDLARIARTYGLAQYYIVTSIPTQIELSTRIINHWSTGFGATYNWTRWEAMQTILLVKDLTEVAGHIEENRKRDAIFVMTSAKRLPRCLTYPELGGKIAQSIINNQSPQSEVEYCILFGTGWGLHYSLAEDVDLFLEPIPGFSDDFNHLSVRTAAAIIIDRLICSVESALKDDVE